MRYISIFSGIEAASVALEPLGYEPVCFSELPGFASEVLAYRYPHVPNVGDMTQHDWAQYRGQVDLVVGGPPCQAFSVAGLRGGLADDRGNLSLQFVKAVHAIGPRYLIAENVPGWLNMSDNAFGCFLAGLVGADLPLCSLLDRGKWPDAGMVAGPRARVAWRILDAQYFGLAQRRKRVFVVASFGDSGDPAEILFERKSLQGDPPACRKAGEDIAPTIGARTSAGDGLGTGGMDFESETLIAFDCKAGANTGFAIGDIPGPQRGEGHGGGHHAIAFSCKDYGNDAQTDITPTLRAMNHSGSHANAGGQMAVAFALRGREGGAMPEMEGEQAGALRAASGGSSRSYVAHYGVRRLLPSECEILQGFPKNWTQIPRKGKPASECPDGPRYKAIGNSFPVPVISWIGSRMMAQFLRIKDAA